MYTKLLAKHLPCGRCLLNSCFLLFFSKNVKKNHPESTGNLYPKGCSVSEAAGSDALLCECVTGREARREKGADFYAGGIEGK